MKRSFYVVALIMALLNVSEIVAQEKFRYRTSAGTKSELFYAVNSNGKFGYIDINDNVKIPFIYDWVSIYSSQGYASVNVNGKFGIIDKQGKYIIQPIYEYTYSFIEMPYFMVQKDGLFGVADKTGKLIVPIDYTHIGPVVSENTTFTAVLNGKWGVVGENNKVLVPFQWKYIRFDRDNGSGRCFAESTFGYFCSDGTVIKDPKYKNVDEFKKGYKVVTDDTKKKGVLNKNNELVIPFEYSSISQVDENPELFMVTKSGREGVYNVVNRSFVIPMEFSSIAGTYNDIFFATRRDEVEEFYDLNGKQVGRQSYEYSTPVEFFGANKNQFALVKKGEKWGTIDIKGNVVVPIEMVGEDEDDFAFMKGWMMGETETGWGAVDHEGRVVIPFKYWSAPKATPNPFHNLAFDHELFAVRENGTNAVGVIDKKGSWVRKYTDGSSLERPLERDPVTKKYYLTIRTSKGGLKIVDVASGKEHIPIPNDSYDNLVGAYSINSTSAEVTNFGTKFKEGIYLLEDQKTFISKEYKYKAFIKGENVFIVEKSFPEPGSLTPVSIYGLMNKQGGKITDFVFDNLQYDSEAKLFYARKKDKNGYIDKDGNEVIPISYDTVMVKWDNYIPPSLHIPDFKNGYVSLRKGNRQILISKKQEQMVDTKPFGYKGNGYMSYQALGNFYTPMMENIYNPTGERGATAYKKQIYLNNEVYDCFRGRLNWDLTGKFVEDANTMLTDMGGPVFFFSDGLLCARKNGKFGYLDFNGKEVIPFEYDDAGSFLAGMAVVKKNGECFLINNLGKRMQMTHLIMDVFQKK